MPAYGHWLTPDPLGFDAGPNLYAYVSNCPLTHIDVYGLIALSYPSFFTKERTIEDAKQTIIGSIHGIGNFALETTSFASYIGYGFSLPYQSIGWMAGRSSFSESWSFFQNFNHNLHTSGTRLMHRILPGDETNDFYGGARWGTSTALEFGLIGPGVAKKCVSSGFRYLSGKHKQLSQSLKTSREMDAVLQNTLKVLHQKIILEAKPTLH